MCATKTHFNPHQIDCDKAKVAVISDLHKYSGVSNFSKGDDPMFDIYHALYLQHNLGNIPKHNHKLTDAEKEEIVKTVKSKLPREEIETDRDIEILRQQKDPHGLWKRRQEVFESFKDANYVVLNGDIFDIECAKDPTAKILEAVDWLKKRMDEAPDTQFHFVLGNHENFVTFVKALKGLEKDDTYKKQFHFHEHYFRLNDSLFVHGDEFMGVVNYVKLLNKLGSLFDSRLDTKEDKMVIQGYIKEWNKKGRPPRELIKKNIFSRKAYEWFSNISHKFRNLWGTTDHIVAKLYDGIQSSEIKEKDDPDGLASAFAKSTYVFSGHTHEPYAVHFKDKYFYNTGAALGTKFAESFRLTKFWPLTVQMQNGKTHYVEPLLKKYKDIAHQRETIDIVTLKEPQRYFVISDMHLFADDRSRYETDARAKAAIDNAMDRADVIVLNGDIFDLTFPPAGYSVDNSIHSAIVWLRQLMEKYPDKQIHYLMGNHEAVDEFKIELEKIHSNHFFFHERVFQPNEKNIFLHGDEVSTTLKRREMYTLDNARASEDEVDINRIGAKHAIKLVKWWSNPPIAAQKVSSAIRNWLGEEKAKKVENIFFGHTHVPFVDQATPEGKWVTNTGTLQDHAPFAAVEFYMSEDGTISPPRLIDNALDKHVVPVGPHHQSYNYR